MAKTSFEIQNVEEYKRAILNLYKMGEIRKRDISAVFRKATSPMVSAMKRGAGVSRGGVPISRYGSRIHTSGNLKRSIKFKVSRKYRLVYFVGPTAWYSQIYIMQSKDSVLGSKGGGKAAFIPGVGWRKGTFKGHAAHPFVETAINQTESTVEANIMNGIFEIEQKIWRNGR